MTKNKDREQKREREKERVLDDVEVLKKSGAKKSIYI